LQYPYLARSLRPTIVNKRPQRRYTRKWEEKEEEDEEGGEEAAAAFFNESSKA